MLQWLTKHFRPEAKSLSAPDADLYEIFGVIPSTVAVSTTVALSVPAVSSAIRVISEAAASLDVKIMRVADDGTETEDRSHPAGRLLRGDANDWLSGYELIRGVVAQALMHDNGGLAWVNRVNGEPREIIHYIPGMIGVEYASEGTNEPTYKLNGQTIPSRDVIHVRGAFSRAPLTLAKEAIGIAHVLETHAVRLFRNGARPGGVIEIPGNIGDEGLKKLRSAWRAAHEGADNAGKTATLFGGAKFNPLTMTSTDAQFLELRKFQILEIARAFRVPPSMLFELDRATWSNSEQMGREFLTYTLEPWLRSLEGAFRRALFTPEERATHRIWFERDDLTRADLAARATAYSSLISSRVLNPNEARAWEGLPPYADGEAFINPNTTRDGGQETE